MWNNHWILCNVKVISFDSSLTIFYVDPNIHFTSFVSTRISRNLSLHIFQIPGVGRGKLTDYDIYPFITACISLPSPTSLSTLSTIIPYNISLPLSTLPRLPEVVKAPPMSLIPSSPPASPCWTTWTWLSWFIVRVALKSEAWKWLKVFCLFTSTFVTRLSL